MQEELRGAPLLHGVIKLLFIHLLRLWKSKSKSKSKSKRKRKRKRRRKRKRKKEGKEKREKEKKRKRKGENKEKGKEKYKREKYFENGTLEKGIYFSSCLLPVFWSSVKGVFWQKLNTVGALINNFLKRREPIKQLQLFSCWMENLLCKVSVLPLYHYLWFLKNESY